VPPKNNNKKKMKKGALNQEEKNLTKKCDLLIELLEASPQLESLIAVAPGLYIMGWENYLYINYWLKI
jgi:hypothetical protein